MQIPRMGVKLCNGDSEDANKLPNAQMEQRKAEGKSGKEISRPCRARNPHANLDESNDSSDENPSKDEVQFGDENVPSKASKSTTTQAHKKPKLGGHCDMFDVKGRESVDLAIAIFFLACGIPFNTSQSPYFE